MSFKNFDEFKSWVKETQQTIGDKVVTTVWLPSRYLEDVLPLIPKDRVDSSIKHGHKRRWTSQDDSLLKDLYSQNLPLRDIATKLDRSKSAILHRIERLSLSSHSQAKYKKDVNETSSRNHDVVKEFLSACSLLYPSHRKACAFLLQEASNKILAEEKP